MLALAFWEKKGYKRSTPRTMLLARSVHPLLENLV